MANTNCLEGIQCPDCGNEDSFRIAATTVATVSDNGVEDYGDTEWDEDSYAECTRCNRHGMLKDFGQSRRHAVPDAVSLADGPATPTRRVELIDPFAAILAYESGELDEAGALSLFQHLVDTGMAWRLQGHYGRTARGLIDAGLIEPPAAITAASVGNPIAFATPEQPSNGRDGKHHDNGNER